MVLNKTILIASFFFLLSSCIGIDCNKLPKSYNSYDDAVKTIKMANFKINETVNATKSSWVKSASYYSCDGSFGFFILKTDNQEYLHSDVPVDTWNRFKNAESFGMYYNRNIKHKFSFRLNQ
jgi:hypothetical protein